MAFNDQAKRKTVTGTFQGPTGDPVKGKITLRLIEPVFGRDEKVIYTDEPKTLTLDAQGSFTTDITVTKRSLTDEEQNSLNLLTASLETKATTLKTTQDAINEYLKKQYEGVVPTQQQVQAYNNNLAAKKTITKDIIAIQAQINTFNAKKKKLESEPVILAIDLDYTSKRIRRTRLRVYISPADTSPVDISRLEKAN